MQNVIEILKEMGIEIPEGKSEELTKKVAENYKTVAEHDNKVKKLEEDRDKWKKDAEEAQETLKGMDGKSLEDITKDRDKWKTEAENREKKYKEQIAQRDYSDAVTKAVETLKFSSNAAKKQFISDITADPLKLKDGKLLGFDDYVKSYKESDASAFVDEEQQHNEENQAQFTGPMNEDHNSEPITGDPNKMDFATYKKWRAQNQ